MLMPIIDHQQHNVYNLLNNIYYIFNNPAKYPLKYPHFDAATLIRL
jgi:hypothetical protein